MCLFVVYPSTIKFEVVGYMLSSPWYPVYGYYGVHCMSHSSYTYYLLDDFYERNSYI